MSTTFLTQDVPVLLAAMLASAACGLIGCFLVLRRMSLMGDAISHAVLPGIIAAFLLTKSLGTIPVLIGAAFIGVITAALSELIRRLGRVEPGASMGVVFTVLFALGVIMLARIEHTTAQGVHLDADCVLYGTMENVLWIDPPDSFSKMTDAASWRFFPPQIITLLVVLLLDLVFVIALFKELRITAFDPGLAAAQGISPGLMHYLLMTFVAITTVASFEAVGSILVVAMLIVPGVAAHLLTDRLSVMLWLSVIIGVAASATGYGAAAALDLNAAGMIGVMLGVLLTIIAVFAPRHGWLARRSSAERQTFGTTVSPSFTVGGERGE